jgi:hypothetical protein
MHMMIMMMYWVMVKKYSRMVLVPFIASLVSTTQDDEKDERIFFSWRGIVTSRAEKFNKNEANFRSVTQLLVKFKSLCGWPRLP